MPYTKNNPIMHVLYCYVSLNKDKSIQKMELLDNSKLRLLDLEVIKESLNPNMFKFNYCEAFMLNIQYNVHFKEKRNCVQLYLENDNTKYMLNNINTSSRYYDDHFFSSFKQSINYSYKYRLSLKELKLIEKSSSLEEYKQNCMISEILL